MADLMAQFSQLLHDIERNLAALGLHITFSPSMIVFVGILAGVYLVIRWLFL